MRALLLAIALGLAVPSVALAGKPAAEKGAKKKPAAKKRPAKRSAKATKRKKPTSKKRGAKKRGKRKFRMRRYHMTLENVNTKEKLKNLWVIRHDPKNPNKQWVGKRAHKRLTHFLRDWRTGRTKRIPERLVWLLYLVQQRFDAPIEVVSGYRHKERKTSRHKQARAVDFRVEGVDPKVVWEYCKRFDNVGLGWYPNSKFVHMDVRDRSRYWVDDSGPGEEADYREDVAQRKQPKKKRKAKKKDAAKKRAVAQRKSKKAPERKGAN